MNIKNRNFFGVMVLAATLISCTNKVFSELKTDNGTVIEKQYVPDTRQIVSGTGFSTKGSLIITTHSIGQDEQFIVIIKSDKGLVFSTNEREIFGRLNKNDNVKLKYHEIRNSNNKIINNTLISVKE